MTTRGEVNNMPDVRHTPSIADALKAAKRDTGRINLARRKIDELRAHRALMWYAAHRQGLSFYAIAKDCGMAESYVNSQIRGVIERGENWLD